MGYNLKVTKSIKERGKPMATKVILRLFTGILLFLVATPVATSCGGTEPDTVPSSVPIPKPGEEIMIEFKDTGSMPPMLADTSKKYYAYMETEKGTLVLELFAEDVPMAVSNFVYLAQEGFYDGTTFHRVIPGFVAQGGDPTGTGTGGPGYTFGYEITGHKHIAGTLSMAHSALPDSNGSQFFICYAPQPGLDGGYSVFGQLIEGMDVLQSLTPRDPSQNPNFEGDRIISVKIAVE
jgi:cyclophilin family peptidyl-prolyl cis-trans isomerase